MNNNLGDERTLQFAPSIHGLKLFCELFDANVSVSISKLYSIVGHATSRLLTVTSWSKALGRIRDVTKISSCWVNTKRTHKKDVFFFYFPMKVARGHVHYITWQKSSAPAS